MKEQNEHCRKTSYKKVGYDLKLVIIDQIQNAQISINHASEKYQVSRASIYYWLKKCSTLDSIKLSIKSLFTTNNISSNKPIWIKQLREIIEDRWNEFISLDELALILNVHPVTISKYFKNITMAHWEII